MKTSEIEITGYEERIISGRLINPFYAEAKPFHGMVQLISLIENICDELNFPEQTLEMRDFNGFGERMKLTECNKNNSESVITRFNICLHFRQNASWQGSLSRLEHKETANFRSVLELIYLIDTVLLGLIENHTSCDV